MRLLSFRPLTSEYSPKSGMHYHAEAAEVINFGTFDLLQVDHLRMLKRAKNFGDNLVLGVSSDQLNSQKNRYTEFNRDERLEMVKTIKGVDSMFLEEGSHLARLQLFR